LADLPLTGNSRNSAFTHREQTYQWVRLPFGLCHAPKHFHTHTVALLKDFQFTLVFLDDILIMGSSPEDFIDKIKLVFDKLREARLRIHREKMSVRHNIR
jgi:Reverse transcriptase (RNA-dependent DNA polymerase)